LTDYEALGPVDASVALRPSMSKPRLSYTPRQDVTREGELTALAAVYKLILEGVEKRAAHTCGLDDGKEMKECSCREASCPKGK
jgi:hypothetical protein